MMRFTAPALVFLLLAVVFFVGLGRDPSHVPSPLIGRQAPEFTLPRLDDPDQMISRDDLLGQVSVLNVWATWCVGCREEHSTLMAIAQRGEVPIFGLNWKDDAGMARRWLDRAGDPYTAIALDTDGRVGIDWGVYGTPETFLVGIDGTVLYKHIAPITMEIWEREFVPRIEAERSAAL